MDIALVLVREVIMLAMLICLGIFTRKKGMFTEDTAQRLAAFLISIVTPVLMVHTLHREKDPELLPGFLATLVLSTLMFLLSVAVSMFIFRSKNNPGPYRSERLAMVLPNCGFMGIPLLMAAAGADSIIYVAGMIGPFNVLVWCWAIPMMDRKKPSLMKLLINPGICGFAAGLLIFFLEIRLPVLAAEFIGYISALNTPLSMLMIGVFLADVDLRGIWNARVLKVVLGKNIVIPMLSLLAIYVLRLDELFGRTFAISFQILAACPSATSALLLPVRVGEDGGYPAKLIAVSTLCSVATLPLVAYITQRVL